MGQEMQVPVIKKVQCTSTDPIANMTISANDGDFQEAITLAHA